MRYPQIKDGEWITPIHKGYKMICCCCGLVHDADFRFHKKEIQFRVRRNNRSTALTRKRMREKGYPDIERR